MYKGWRLLIIFRYNFLKNKYDHIDQVSSIELFSLSFIVELPM